MYLFCATELDFALWSHLGFVHFLCMFYIFNSHSVVFQNNYMPPHVQKREAYVFVGTCVAILMPLAPVSHVPFCILGASSLGLFILLAFCTLPAALVFVGFFIPSFSGNLFFFHPLHHVFLVALYVFPGVNGRFEMRLSPRLYSNHRFWLSKF